MKKIVYASAIFGIVLAACTKSNYEIDHPKVIATPTAVKDTCKDSIAYNPQIKRILDANCATASCHVSGMQSPDLSNYTSAKTNAALIITRAVNEKNMPQDNNGNAVPLTNTCDLQKLKAWVDGGLLENK